MPWSPGLQQGDADYRRAGRVGVRRRCGRRSAPGGASIIDGGANARRLAPRVRPFTMPAAPIPGLATPGRTLAILAVLAVAALATLALALSVGSVAVDGAAILRALGGESTGTADAIVRELRLPRALAAFAAGGLLALAGALMQVLLRNPLADPYMLGISGGAAVGALGAMLAGAAALVTAAAFSGALASTLLVFGLARGGGERAPWTVDAPAPHGRRRRGRLGRADRADADARPRRTGQGHAVLADRRPRRHDARGAGAGCAGRHPRRRAGVRARPQRASARGARRRRARRRRGPHVTLVLCALAALATAAAVTTAGSVGFVGLVVPHALRLVIGNDQRVLLPASALAGGALLVLADTLARSVVAPAQLPVGVITALVGVPVFLALLAPGAHVTDESPRLSCRGLALAVAGRTLVSGLDLDVRAGECWVVVGPNGAGKTTLVATLAGLAPPAAGEIAYDGTPLSRVGLRERALRRGFLPQDSVDFFPATVLETVLVGRHPHLARWEWESAADVARARNALAAIRSRRPRRARRAHALRRRAAARRAGRAPRAGSGAAAAGRAVVAPRPRPADRRARRA